MEQELRQDGDMPDAQQLQLLLEMLELPIVPGLPAFAPRQRAASLRRILEQSRRIAANSGSREQIAVVELHMGLYQAQWQEWSGAGQHFERARREALRGNHRPLACLALFASGCMRQRDFDFEGALAAFSEAEAKSRSMRRLLGVRGFDARQNRDHDFLDELELALEQAQHSLQADLEQEVTTRLESVSTDRMPRTIPLGAAPPPAGPPPPAGEPATEDWRPIVSPTLRATHPQAPQVNFPTKPVAEPGTGAPNIVVEADSEHDVAAAAGPLDSMLIRALPPKPHHYYFQLRAGYDLFCVLHAGESRNLGPELIPDDWLIVKRQHSHYNMGDLVAVGSAGGETRLDGEVRLAEDCATQERRPTFYLGRVVSQQGKQVEVDTGVGALQTIEPEQPIKLGKVVGFFRYLPSQPRVPAAALPAETQAITSDCADAPDPHYFLTREGITVYCVSSRKSDGLLPGLLAGDWLLAESVAGDPAENDLIIVRVSAGNEEAGSIHVQAGEEVIAQVGEMVLDPDTGELELLVAAERRMQLQSQTVLGTVIGFFRNLAR